MSKQFDFIKPIVRIDEQLLLDSGYTSIFGVKFFREDIRKEIWTTYFEDRRRKETKTYLKETRVTKAAEEVTDEQWRLFNKFKNEKDKWCNVIIGGVYCPFTDTKLRDIYFGKPKRKGMTLHYFEKGGDKRDTAWGSFDILDPHKVAMDTSLDGWYAPDVLAVMRNEWSFDNSTNVDLNAPDLTVLADDLDRISVFYNKRGNTAIESKLVYISKNGRYFKNRGKKNAYIDSPAIDDFLTKIKNK